MNTKSPSLSRCTHEGASIYPLFYAPWQWVLLLHGCLLISAPRLIGRCYVFSYYVSLECSFLDEWSSFGVLHEDSWKASHSWFSSSVSLSHGTAWKRHVFLEEWNEHACHELGICDFPFFSVSIFFVFHDSFEFSTIASLSTVCVCAQKGLFFGWFVCVIVLLVCCAVVVVVVSRLLL